MQGPIPNPLVPSNAWPWQDSSNRVVHQTISTTAPPRLSIVIPSYNQGAYIEKAIRSVLLQDYGNWELIIMDGGSADDSVKVIRHYADCLAHWQSEQDGGQSQAINRGIHKATGDLLAWMNSDDYYLPKAFSQVATLWMRGGKPDWIAGGARFLRADGQLDHEWLPIQKTDLGNILSSGCGVAQISSFWSQRLWDKVGGVDESLELCMDEDLLLRFHIAGAFPLTMTRVLAESLLQDQCKTVLNSPKYSGVFASFVRKYCTAVPREQMREWKSGVKSTSERWGAQAWQCLTRKDFKGMGEYLRAGAGLNLPSALYGMLRGPGSYVKRTIGRQRSQGHERVCR